MLQLQKIKWFDLIMQIGLAVTFLVYATINGNFKTTLYTYYAVGAWQVGSCLLHKLMVAKQLKTIGRTVYEFCLLFLFICSSIVLSFQFRERTLQGLSIYFGYAMLFAGPVMAVFYSLISLTEINKVRKAG